MICVSHPLERVGRTFESLPSSAALGMISMIRDSINGNALLLLHQNRHQQRCDGVRNLVAL